MRYRGRDNEPRDTVIALRVTSSEAKEMRKLAKLYKMTLSQFFEFCIVKFMESPK
jgi:hypothetical protein